MMEAKDIFDVMLIVTGRYEEMRGIEVDTHCQISARYVTSPMSKIKWDPDQSRMRPQRDSSSRLEFEPILTQDEQAEFTDFIRRVSNRIFEQAYVGDKVKADALG